MGLGGGTKPDAWRGNAWNLSKTTVIFLSFFAVGLVYSILAMGVRATQFYSPIPGLELVPAIASGIGFAVAAMFFKNVTGGFVYHMHIVMTMIIGSIFNWAGSTAVHKLHERADRNWAKMNVWRLVLASFGLVIGAFVAGILIWLVTGTFYQFVPQSPGAFPGLSNDPADALRAFAAEAIFSGILGIALTVSALNAKWYRQGLGFAAFAVAAFVGLGFNISGTSLDLAIWVSHHLAVAVVFGQTPFTAAPYGGITVYWYAYVFGNMVGWFVGVLIGYFLAGCAVPEGKDMSAFEEQAKEDQEAFETTGRSVTDRLTSNASGSVKKRSNGKLNANAIGNSLFGVK